MLYASVAGEKMTTAFILTTCLVFVGGQQYYYVALWQLEKTSSSVLFLDFLSMLNKIPLLLPFFFQCERGLFGIQECLWPEV